MKSLREYLAGCQHYSGNFRRPGTQWVLSKWQDDGTLGKCKPLTTGTRDPLRAAGKAPLGRAYSCLLSVTTLPVHVAATVPLEVERCAQVWAKGGPRRGLCSNPSGSGGLRCPRPLLRLLSTFLVPSLSLWMGTSTTLWTAQPAVSVAPSPGPPPPCSKPANSGHPEDRPRERCAAAPVPGARVWHGRRGPTGAGHVAAVPACVAPVTVGDLKEAVAGVVTLEVLIDGRGVELALKISQAHP